MFKNIGVILSVLTFLIGGYEAVALLSPLPTISRMMQGLRDAGHPGVVWIISGIFVCVLALFGAWLYYHLNFQTRSGN